MPGTRLKYENNPKIKKAIAQKFTEYLRPAEEIRFVLDEGRPGPTPKTKPKDVYSGGDGQDHEQS
ncbi:putative protein SUPPRESSOR OF K(+) TRANSPORT GROWTH DEFECT 1 [Cocos nucifera]|uniref:Uncharacterized protein n=1 Tax=Cocos nucifera TaxID=13894 RepID=A0A8K0IE24_COCNU|nr:putative protein SUPPRESSOR OF K(+) TRANSPORT GROWTH DEFECT 1 [Cocos nucifera]